MKRKKAILIFLLTGFGFFHPASGQIVNMEANRDQSDTAGWSGSTDTGFNFFKYVISGYSLYNETRVQYETKRHFIIFKGAIDYTRFDKINYSNSAYAHLRHNLKINKRWRIEEFTQIQYNQIMGLTARYLAGAGPRLNLIKKKSLETYCAVLPMYEYQKNQYVQGVYEEEHNFRISAYLNFTLRINEILSLVHTTYYQPLVRDFSDYKVNSDTGLRIGIGKKASIDIGFHYTFNSRFIRYFPYSTYYLTDSFHYYF